MTQRTVFLFNLLQDVSILRPLVLLARRVTERPILILHSTGFSKRDLRGDWMIELHHLARATGATIASFASPFEALHHLRRRSGMIVAGSESDLAAHQETHDLFRAAPPGFLRVTLQHGMECVGFRQTREHIIRHTRNVGFAADVLCTWQEPELLTAMKPSERGKVTVTGPSTLLAARSETPGPGSGGLVCENLHSVRVQTTGANDVSFMTIFRDFCESLAAQGRRVTLRPHPGGQYVLKRKLSMPANVTLNNLPIYRFNLGCYDYGLSAPSTVVLDMVLAGLPTAVWRDPGETMDTRGYDGLTPVSSLDEWLCFVRDVEERPEMLLARQRRWLDGTGVQLNPAVAYRRFAALIAASAPDLG